MVAGLVGVLVLFVEHNTSITTSHKSSASDPSIRSPVSNEIISDSVELWDTDVCFLHIDMIGTYVPLLKLDATLPRSRFRVLKVTRKICLEINPIDNAEPCYPDDNIAGHHLCEGCMISILPNVCQKLVSI